MQAYSVVTDTSTYSHKRVITALSEEEAKEHAKTHCNDLWLVTLFYKSLNGNQWIAKYVATEEGCR